GLSWGASGGSEAEAGRTGCQAGGVQEKVHGIVAGPAAGKLEPLGDDEFAAGCRHPVHQQSAAGQGNERIAARRAARNVESDQGGSYTDPNARRTVDHSAGTAGSAAVALHA